MIKLTVEDYCQDCDEFEPEVSKLRIHLSDEKPFDWQYGPTKTDTIIKCKHGMRCACIKRYLSKQENKNVTR